MVDYSNAQFMERKATIIGFKQEEAESFSDTQERFKLLLYKCLNHNMIAKEKQTYFMGGLKVMLLNASIVGTLMAKIDEMLKTLIENMCQNKYLSSE